MPPIHSLNLPNPPSPPPPTHLFRWHPFYHAATSWTPVNHHQSSLIVLGCEGDSPLICARLLPTAFKEEAGCADEKDVRWRKMLVCLTGLSVGAGSHGRQACLYVQQQQQQLPEIWLTVGKKRLPFLSLPHFCTHLIFFLDSASTFT